MVGALFLFYVATVLLICVSTGPAWSKMSFMDIRVLNQTYHCGIWGYTGQPTGLGYVVDPASVGLPENVPWQNVSPSVLKQLSGALVLHVLGVIFAFIAFLSGLIGLAIRRDPKANLVMVATGFISFFLILGAISVDIALWWALYNVYSPLPLDGASYSIGVAFWLTLFAGAALFFAAFTWELVLVMGKICRGILSGLSELAKSCLPMANRLDDAIWHGCYRMSTCI